VKTLSLLIILLASAACVEKIKGYVGLKPTAELEAEPVAYKPEPPPSVETDRTIQLTPKERVLTLFAQFNRSPDETLAGLVLAGVSENKTLFTTKIDDALKTEINRSIPLVQQGDRLAIKLLAQLLTQLVGENKEHLRGVLAQGFDSAPAMTAEYITRMNEEKLCNLILLVPLEVTPEAKYDFLLARFTALTALRTDTSLAPGTRLYVDTCARTLEIALNPSAPPTATISVPDPAATPAPATP